jgi:hypothetical protein
VLLGVMMAVNEVLQMAFEICVIHGGGLRLAVRIA